VPKHRLGVVLLIPEPVAAEVDTLRRALGDPALGRIPAHLTLVPPVNVRHDRMEEALAVLRAAGAATAGPLHLTIGPVATFLPVNPVLYLRVGGDLEELQQLRDAVFRGPLERPLTWPFVAHVTVADDSPAEIIEPALVALAGYQAAITVDRVHILEEGLGRRWEPVADAAFRPAAIVGRGGLPIELTVTEGVDPRSRRSVTDGRPVAITARRDGAVVGVAEGFVREAMATLTLLVVAGPERGTGVARHLLAAFASATAELGAERHVALVDHPVLRRLGWTTYVP
jgi:2'-5' RNA ligase